MKHGITAYKYWDCRCETCTAANRDEHWRADQARRERLEAGTDQPAVHNANTYTNWGCRCDVCTKANRARCRARKERLKAAAS